METPKDELFYFKPDELLSLKLATRRRIDLPHRVKSDIEEGVSREESSNLFPLA